MKWHKGAPPKIEDTYWLVEFVDGDRFVVVRYIPEDDRFENQDDGGYISDPIAFHHLIGEPISGIKPKH